MINTSYNFIEEERKEKFEKLLNETKTIINTQKDFYSYIYGQGVNSFNRMDAFFSIEEQINKKIKIKCFKEAATNSDALYKNRNQIKNFIQKFDRVEFYLSNTSKEKQFLENLNDEIVVFRGCSLYEIERKEFGYSWTTDIEVARRFAFKDRVNSQHKETQVVMLRLHKMLILFINLSRGERELFIEPEIIQNYLNNKRILL